MITRVEQKDW